MANFVVILILALLGIGFLYVLYFLFVKVPRDLSAARKARRLTVEQNNALSEVPLASADTNAGMQQPARDLGHRSSDKLAALEQLFKGLAGLLTACLVLWLVIGLWRPASSGSGSEASSDSSATINSVDDMKKASAGTWCATGFYKIVISSDGTHYSWYLRRADTDAWPKKPDQTGTVIYKHERYGDTGNVYYEAQMDGLALQADAGHPVNGYLDFAAGDGEPIGGINAASHDCQQYESH